MYVAFTSQVLRFQACATLPVMVGIELRASHMLGKAHYQLIYSPNSSHPPFSSEIEFRR